MSFLCNECPNSYSRKYLELDMKQQTIFSKNLIVLEIANEIVNQVMHDLDKLKCEVCHSKFSNFDSLSRHMRKFPDPPSEKVKKEYKCDVCQKSFVAPSHLKQHITVHEKTKDYTCNFCQKIFLVPSKLKRHL